MTIKIGFVGMTHLGLVSSLCAAEKGFDVVCFDLDHQLIEDIAQGRLPISEPRLIEVLGNNREKVILTSNADGLSDCNLIYVSPDIATNDKGDSDLSAIDQLLDLVFSASTPDTVIVVLSQVPPGYVRSKKLNKRKLFYQVETLIFGQAVHRALNPERYIVGCADPHLPLPPQYLEFLEAHDCEILKMRYESAELAKISINMFLVASVTTANTLAELCEQIGADWHEIVPALRLDRRIGPYAYLNPGLGISGGNLERDLATFKSYAKKKYTEYGVVDAWIQNSEHRKSWLSKKLSEIRLTKAHPSTVAVLGLTYKENTHSVKNSPAIKFLRSISGLKIKAYDPAASFDVVPNHIQRVLNIEDALDGADVLIVATAWPEFKNISIDQLVNNMSGRVIIDPYRILSEVQLRAKGFEYYSLGVGDYYELNK